jgi:hypothetical protein
MIRRPSCIESLGSRTPEPSGNWGMEVVVRQHGPTKGVPAKWTDRSLRLNCFYLGGKIIVSSVKHSVVSGLLLESIKSYISSTTKISSGPTAYITASTLP